MKDNHAIRVFLLVYGIVSIAITYSIAQYYGGITSLLRIGIFPGLFYPLLFFLATGSIAIIFLAYGEIVAAVRKERETLGEPKRLTRNYFIIGFLIFLVVALISYFDLLNEEQLRIVHRVPEDFTSKQKLSSSLVRYVYLPDIQELEEVYLKACVDIAKDLKAANARVAIVHFPAGLTLTKENINYLTELKKTGIVVLSVKPSKRRYIGEEATWIVEDPTLFQFEMPWGVASAAFNRGLFLQYTPYEYRVLGSSADDRSATLVADISLEAIRKYAAYSDNLEPKRIGNKVVFGEYRIPVFRKGFTYSTIGFGSDWLTGDSSVKAAYDKKLSKISYSDPNVVGGVQTRYMQSALAEFWRNKIVIISPRPPLIGNEYRGTLFYRNIILSILTRNLLLPLDDWNPVFILLSIILAAVICYKFRPLYGVFILSAIVIPVVFFVGLILLNQFNVFVQTLYMILSIGICAVAMPAAKSAQKKREVEEKMLLEVEKKTILESQKDQLEQQVAQRTSELRVEKDKSDRLLYNILPKDIADELKESGVTPARRFEEVSILFTDFRGFTATVASVPASRLVDELNDIFHHVDDITERSGLEKIKTIGDAYMAVAGLPKESNTHAVQAVKAALQILQYIDERNKTSFIKWEMRVGIHSGTVVAGVVGKWKFTYDVWGDAVNIASRLESSGVPGKINISAFTYDLIKDHFKCEYRGKIDAKGKGEIDMYLVVGEKETAA